MANDDFLIFIPEDVDLARSPLRGIEAETYVLGAFNPGLTRLANGNLLLMVRVAQALRDPVDATHARSLRWTTAGCHIDNWPRDRVDGDDPRVLKVADSTGQARLALTSLSWLLPVELDTNGNAVVAVHYDRAIVPATSYQCYGIEDPRISRIGDIWYMTACSVSPERQCSVLYTSGNALDWHLHGIVLDHQNKDMLLFEGLIDGRFTALTRPLGDAYFAYPPESEFVGGPQIHLATSPDALHWKPFDAAGICARKGSQASLRIGGGTPPVLTDAGWLTLWHGVEQDGDIGTYRTFWALLDRDHPSTILHMADRAPLIEAKSALTADIAHQMYLQSPVVFSTGMVDAGDHWLVASGEADLACRLTRIGKTRFA